MTKAEDVLLEIGVYTASAPEETENTANEKITLDEEEKREFVKSVNKIKNKIKELKYNVLN